MKTAGTVVLLAALFWFFAATFNVFGSSDTYNVYWKYPIVDSSSDDPGWLLSGPSIYRVGTSGNVINLSPNGIPYTYKDCSVFDVKNWTCATLDGTNKFGMREGELWFLEAASKDHVNSVQITELEFHIIGCRWDFVEPMPNLQFIVCALRPFIGVKM